MGFGLSVGGEIVSPHPSLRLSPGEGSSLHIRPTYKATVYDVKSRSFNWCSCQLLFITIKAQVLTNT